MKLVDSVDAIRNHLIEFLIRRETETELDDQKEVSEEDILEHVKS